MSIAKQISKLAQHSAIYAISTAIQKLAGFLLLPIYTNTAYIASRSEFSDYATIFAFTAFMHYFYAYGMDSALLRYFFIGGRDRKTVFSTTLFVLILSSLATTGILLFWSVPVAQALFGDGSYVLFVQLAAVTLFFDVIGNLPYLVLRAEEKSVQYTLLRILRFFLELGLNIYFIVYLKTGVIGVMYTILIASVINFLVTLPISLRYFALRFDAELCREMLSFALPFLPNGIAFTMIELIDRFIIPAILDKDALGLYSANYKFGTILLQPVLAFRTAWQPFFLKVSSQENAKTIYSRVLTYFTMIAGLIIIGGTFFLGDLLRWNVAGFTFLGQEYWEGINMIPIILLSYLFLGMYMIFTPGFYIEKKSK
ncbi:MAG: oligosaccharide flippase family protein, partial [Calditrichota bacterium]